MTAGHFYEFGPFRLDKRERRLERDGEPVSLTPKCFDLLVVLVENAGQLLSKTHLMEALWPDRVVEEGNLSFNISELRRVLGEGQSEFSYIETVRGQGFRFVAPVQMRERTTSPVELSGQRWKVIATTLAAAALAVLVFAVWKGQRPRPSDARPVRTIAVLPFKPLVAASRDESLELGMADTLITRLGVVRAVTVRPISAVRRYMSLDQDPVAIARELGVEAVLDGSIQRNGDRVRVTVRLTKVADGALLWSDAFDEKFTDIFTVQDVIGEQVVRSLALRLSGDEERGLAKRGTVNADAYTHYLKGRFFLSKRSEDGFRKAIESFRQAAGLDPAYAAAYAGLADSYSLLSVYSDVPPGDSFPLAKAAAARALSLDDSLAEAHSSLGWVAEAYEWNWAAAEKEYRKALALDPLYATAHNRYGVFLVMNGRFDEGLRELETALQLDPLSVIINADIGMANYLARRYDAAIEQLRKTIEMEPEFVRAHGNLAEALAQKGLFAEAIAEAQTAARLSGGRRRAVLAYVYGAAGRKEEALRLLEESAAPQQGRFRQPLYGAAAWAALGENDRAFEVLEKGFQDRAYMLRMGVDPALDRLRSDPRFSGLMRRVGVPVR